MWRRAWESQRCDPPVTDPAAEAAAPDADLAAEPKRARHLRVVSEPDAPDGESGRQGWAFEPPDTLALERERALLREAMPHASEAVIDSGVEFYSNHLSAHTVRSYEQKLRDFFEYAAANGFNPLTCEPPRIKGYVVERMNAGKPGSSKGGSGESEPYSVSYFTSFLSALRCATRAQGLPDHTARLKLSETIRGYSRSKGSALPRMAKSEIRANDLIEIERTARLGCTYPAAQLRAAIAIGCDPDLDFSVSQLCALTFKDVVVSGATATIAASRGPVGAIEIPERPGDPTCPVAALRSLREATRNHMRAQRGGSTPTDAQLRDEHLFTNKNTGAPLSRKGLKLIVGKACAGLQELAPPARGRLAPLGPRQRRQAMTAASDTTTVRDLAMIFHTAFCSARAGNVGDFSVEHVEVWGRDVDGASVTTPLVDRVERDGSVTKGILSRIAVITPTDILDENGNSLYGSLIMGVHTIFAYGTKTQKFHENWYPAQPGWEACPVRLLLKWLKAYDQLLAADSGTRLAGWHPLFSSLKHPGEPINTLSRTLGKAVKTSMARIGRPPDAYSAHSLRKFRASHVLSQGGSMTAVMVHDGRSSEVEGIVYARPDQRDPFAADLMVGLYSGATRRSDATMSESHDHRHDRCGVTAPRHGRRCSSGTALTGRGALPCGGFGNAHEGRLRIPRCRGASPRGRARRSRHRGRRPAGPRLALPQRSRCRLAVGLVGRAIGCASSPGPTSRAQRSCGSALHPPWHPRRRCRDASAGSAPPGTRPGSAGRVPALRRHPPRPACDTGLSSVTGPCGSSPREAIHAAQRTRTRRLGRARIGDDTFSLTPALSASTQPLTWLFADRAGISPWRRRSRTSPPGGGTASPSRPGCPGSPPRPSPRCGSGSPGGVRRPLRAPAGCG